MKKIDLDELRHSDVMGLARATVTDKSDTVLILGDEPALYPHLFEYLRLIRPWKNKIYLNTNGQKIANDPMCAHNISGYLDGINISVHHYLEERNNAIYGSETSDVPFDGLAKAIGMFHFNSVPVRFNTHLIKGTLDTKDDVQQMIRFAADMGANEIHFDELQNCEERWVNARKLFPNLPVNPFHCEYEYEIPNKYGIRAFVKMTRDEN